MSVHDCEVWVCDWCEIEELVKEGHRHPSGWGTPSDAIVGTFCPGCNAARRKALEDACVAQRLLRHNPEVT